MTTAASPTETGARLLDLYQRLLESFGPQHWWPAETAFEVIVGAILTQNTAWANVTRSVQSLKAAGVLEREAMLALPEASLARLIRPSGTYTVKARRLRAVLEWLGPGWERRLREGDLDLLRRDLLAVNGIGPETADAILLYAAGRATFVIDAYTRRILQRLGVAPAQRDYEGYRSLFMANLPHDPALFNEFHAQLVALAKAHCRARPSCANCPLLDCCPTGKEEERWR